MARSRALARRTQRLLGYWRSEQRTFRQGLVALVLSTLAGFVAGLTLAHLTGTLTALPGLLVLIPAAVGMKGTIFGAMGARLGTAQAAGLLTLDLRPGGVLRRNVNVAVLTTFSSSLWLAVLTRVVALASGLPTISLGKLLVISVVGGAIGSVLVLLVTLALSALSSRLNWDLDAVSTPMVTALGDMTTIPSLFLATLLVDLGAVTVVLAVICAELAAALTIRGYTIRDAAVRRIILEMSATILVTPFLDVVAGALQQARLSQLVATPVLLVIIPPFVSQAGALGGIFSSRTTSKLEIGVITPVGRPDTPALVDAAIVAGLSAVVFTLIGSIGWILGDMTGLPGMPAFATLVGLTLLAGMILTPVTLIAGYQLAVLTFRVGLDPDNHGVPIITSLMDLAGVVCLIFVATAIGTIPYAS
ncbi:MAG: magnesium transporter [Actinomycetota bacterium]